VFDRFAHSETMITALDVETLAAIPYPQ
jgi:hypothetical protein